MTEQKPKERSAMWWAIAAIAVPSALVLWAWWSDREQPSKAPPPEVVDTSVHLSAPGFDVSASGGIYLATLETFQTLHRDQSGAEVAITHNFTLEFGDEAAVAAARDRVPEIRAAFERHLRTLTVQDMTGSAGAYRVRLELLRELNVLLAPQMANVVLIERRTPDF